MSAIRCYDRDLVFEAIIAVAIIVALILGAMIPAMTLVWLGFALVAIGALVGVPAGLVYHARLYQALKAEARPTKGMWLKPYELHDKLSEARRDPLLVLFAIGALGFGLTVLGAGALLTGLVRLAGA